MYYNTNHESGATLETSRRKTTTQEAEILVLFRKHTRLTPTIVHTRNLMLFNPPITSIRRAFTDLSKMGLITKTEHMTPGIYGKNEHVWEIVTKQGKLF